MKSAVTGLYAIADLDLLLDRGLPLVEFAEALRDAEVTLIQLRAKLRNPAQILTAATVLRGLFPTGQGLLLMNDRPDLAVLGHCDGVHLGQDDLAVEDARKVLEQAVQERKERIVGRSTHTDEQVRLADWTSTDYIAIGPVFSTGTKLDAAPMVGLEGVRRARALTTKPLVAIGGITLENAESVIAAGADSIAVISGLFVPGHTVEKTARDFLEFFR
jgi:thiamine-phosphate pyrophosphorylase